MNEVKEKETKIGSMIYEIRGQQVMLDSDLARLYGCKNGTKEINQAVKNNLEKFPERFSWKLTNDEYVDLRSKFLTTNYSNMSRSLPRVFTEQGVAMLATVLKSKVATEVSIQIMDAFVAMRRYIGSSNNRISNIESKLIEHDSQIRLLQESFSKLEEKKKTNEIYFDGQIYDAYSKIYEIFNSATEKLIVIDNYADNTLLDIIKRLKVDVVIITKSKGLLTSQDIAKYNSQYGNLKVMYDETFHDRYFILDDNKIYHCGASINRIGYKIFSITLLNDEEVRKLLIDKVNAIIGEK